MITCDKIKVDSNLSGVEIEQKIMKKTYDKSDDGVIPQNSLQFLILNKTDKEIKINEVKLIYLDRESKFIGLDDGYLFGIILKPGEIHETSIDLEVPENAMAFNLKITSKKYGFKDKYELKIIFGIALIVIAYNLFD